MEIKSILITGATGHQGGATINALLSATPQAFKLYALTRNPTSASSLALASKGVTIIHGTTTDPSPIFSKLPSLYGIFLVTVPTADEEVQAFSFIDEAAKHGVKHFVFTSADRGGLVRSETDGTPIPHFQKKLKIERYLKEAAAKTNGQMSWSILRPTSFMENLTPNFIGKCVVTMMRQMGEIRVALVSTKDIGRVAAKCFLEPDKYNGKALTLTGDLLRWDEFEKVFLEEKGKNMEGTWEWVVNGLQMMMPESLGATMKWIRERGYDYENDSELATELGLRDFRTWLKEDCRF